MNPLRLTALVAAAMVLLPSALAAQQPAVVVQLPSYSVFSVNTTVMVPAGGSTHLGSVSRAVAGQSQFGFHPLRSRAAGYALSHRQVGARVWVHDLRAMDRQVLGQAASRSVPGRRWTATSERNRSRSRGGPAARKEPDPFARQFSRTMRQDRLVTGSLARLRARRVAGGAAPKR